MNLNEKVLKVVLAGDEGVGKTCLIHYLIQHRFVDGFHPTVAATVQDWSASVNGQQISIKIWDTAGQERYKSLAPVYFREAHAGIIVFDPSLSGAFESVKSWAEMFKGIVGPTAYFVVACNKIDLVEDMEKIAKITKDIREALDCTVLNVSAKTGENVFTLFQTIAEELYRRSPGNVFTVDFNADAPENQQNCPC